jgi:hypothetical protein
MHKNCMNHSFLKENAKVRESHVLLTKEPKQNQMKFRKCALI